MAIIGKGQLSLLDLNDAIISGTAPTNPSVGTLWIDSSGPKNVLKKWMGSAWEPQPLDLELLDPEFTEYVSEGVAKALLNLGNLSSDDKVTASERQVIADKLLEILGVIPSGTTALPAVATVNTYTSGEYYQARKAATDAGVATSDSTYTALATAYTTFQTYLNGITETGSYLWDVSTEAKDKVHTIVGTTFRSNWQAFYNALLNLQTRTAKRTAEVKAETEAYTKSYRSQLVANGYADLASNRNFGGFVYDTAQKVSGPGSFRRGTTGETVTEEFIRVESDRTYRLAVSLMNSTTSNTHNIGIECFNAAGTTLGKRHLLRAAADSVALPSTTSWVHYEGVIGGVSAGAGVATDRTFPAGTTQVKVWFNLNIGGVANNAFVADVSFALEQIEANKDYNGITMSAEKGLVVESTRNTTTMSATKGIEIKRKSDNANVFSVDANTGNLNITGNIDMVGGTIAWSSVTKPTPEELGVPTKNDFDGVKNTVTGWTVPGTTEINGTSIRTGTFSANQMTTGTLNASVVSVTNLNAANIQTGTLDASKVTISSTTAGVTINSSGVVANNATTGVQVVMNSTTGFEIKKSGNTVFTVNSDGSLIAKNITLQGGSITWGTGTGKITPPTATDVGAAVVGDITNAVKAIDVGGRNVLRYSGNFTSATNSHWTNNGGGLTLSTTEKWNEFNTYQTTVGSGIAGLWYKLENNVEYVYSMMVKASAAFTGTSTVPLHYQHGLNNTSQSGKIQILEQDVSYTGAEVGTYKRIWTRFKLTGDANSFRPFIYWGSGTTVFNIAYIKLEKGNKATDWSPAPEDYDKAISDVKITADEAKSSLQDMTSDLKVTPLEKNELKRLWDAIKLEYTRINDLGVSLAVSSTTRTNFTNAYSALNSTAPRIEADVLASMNTTYDFVSTTNRDTFRTQMNTYFTRREEMEKAIAEQQKTNTTTVANKVTNWESSGDTTFIDGGKIYTGSITAGQIAANAITASKIKVGAVNLINDPFIENPALGTAGATTALSAALWSAGWSTAEREIVADATYGKVLRFRRAGDGTLYTNRFGVDPNKAYRITMTFKHSKTDGTAPTGSLYVGANMYDADGTTEVSTGGFYNIATKTFATGTTNPYFYHPGKGNATHTTWKMLDTYILPAAFYNDRTKLKDASHPAGTGQIMYFNPKTRQIHIRVLSLNSGTYGDNGVTVNELQIASLQVTEVDAGTIVADSIVTGTLNAGLITVTNLNAGSITTGTLDASKITVSNLNAGSLTTGTLNASLVNITNLNASNINTGTLSAARINAGSLTADKLSFSNNVNLMVDGYDSFENCILPGTGARTSGMTISLDSTYSLDGLKSLKFQGTLSDNYVYLVNADNTTTYNIQVVPGKTYMVSFYAYATESTIPIEGWVKRGDTGAHIQFRTAQNTVANQWTRYFGKVTIPTGCTRVSVRVDINVANKPVWFDCFKFEECLTTDSEPGPWASTSLTVIDASNIKTGKLTAIEIEGATIRGADIFADEVTFDDTAVDPVYYRTSSRLNGARLYIQKEYNPNYEWFHDSTNSIESDLIRMVGTDPVMNTTEIRPGYVDSYTVTAQSITSRGNFSASGRISGGGDASFTGKMKSGSVETGSIIIPTSYLNLSGVSAEILRLTANSGTHGYLTVYNGTTRVGYLGSISNGSSSMRLVSDSGWVDVAGNSGVNVLVGNVSKINVTATTTTIGNNLGVSGSIDAGTSSVEGSLVHRSGYMNFKPYDGSTSHSGAYQHGQLYYSGASSTNEFVFSSRTTGNVLSNVDVRANNFVGKLNGTSSIQYKQNVEDYKEDALSKIRSSRVRTYSYKTDDSTERHLGIVIEENAPGEIISRKGDSIDIYGMTSMTWKGIQQLDTKTDYLSMSMEWMEKEILSLKKEKTVMKSRMTKLENKNKELEERIAHIEALLKGGNDK